MTYDWQIAGHKKQLEFLEQTIKRGRLAHAYVFAGPEGVGKRTVAYKLAQILVCENNQAYKLSSPSPGLRPPSPARGEGKFELPCNTCPQCKSFLMSSNADFLELKNEETIKIEQIRDLIYKLSLKAYMAQYKVAVIDSAQNLTDEAQNALLKSIEEPKPNTIIILVTSAPDRLKKTILSRAQKINFGDVDYEEYKLLLPKNPSEEQKRLIREFASQKPGLALRIATDEDFLLFLARIEKQLEDFLSSDSSKRLILVDELKEFETEDLISTLDLWQNKLESKLRNQPTQKFARQINLLAEARNGLDQNINTKLLLVNLMLNADA